MPPKMKGLLIFKKRKPNSPPPEEDEDVLREAREARRPNVPPPNVEPRGSERNKAGKEFEDEDERQQYEACTEFPVLTSKFVNDVFCKKIRIWESVVALSEVSGWETLPTWRVPTFADLTRQFFATLQILEEGELIYFQLCSRRFLLEKNDLT